MCEHWNGYWAVLVFPFVHCFQCTTELVNTIYFIANEGRWYSWSLLQNWSNPGAHVHRRHNTWIWPFTLVSFAVTFSFASIKLYENWDSFFVHVEPPTGRQPILSNSGWVPWFIHSNPVWHHSKRVEHPGPAMACGVLSSRRHFPCLGKHVAKISSSNVPPYGMSYPKPTRMISVASATVGNKIEKTLRTLLCLHDP